MVQDLGRGSGMADGAGKMDRSEDERYERRALSGVMEPGLSVLFRLGDLSKDLQPWSTVHMVGLI